PRKARARAAAGEYRGGVSRGAVRSRYAGALRCADQARLHQADFVIFKDAVRERVDPVDVRDKELRNMMKNQLADLMKQAQQMQDGMKKAQEELAQTEVEGQSGAGLVKVTMTCRYDVRRVSIDPSLLGEDRDMLEDLVAAAINDAVRRVEATTQEKMSGLTAGMPMPPGFKLPF